MLRFIFSFFLLISCASVLAQPAVSVQQEAIQFKKKLLENHVSPQSINDKFSEIVFNDFLKALDPGRVYFINEDIVELESYKLKIDDELGGTSWNFLPAAAQRFKQSLLRAESNVNQCSTTPLDFSRDEILIADTSWAANEKESMSRWKLTLKLETLNELVQIKRNAPEISDKEFLQKKEVDARLRVTKSSLRAIRRILDHPTGYENYVASLFLRSIGHAFDPHSMHLSFAEMQDYATSLTTEGFYFGITVDENERGEIVISELIPGGPAWKSGEVHSGDVIDQVRWAGKDWIQMDGMSKEEMNELLMESVQEVMEFALVNSGGIQKNVHLKKEKMEAEDNVVKSFILEGEKRIGYVSLPGFYSAWGDNESSQCANDVAKEILKLKKENIDGLVLDVRYNRGGSLYEAVAMAGIFIDAGPMGVIKDKSGLNTTVKDMNRGTVYDGPLVLLVNGLSASASEFLAAALQDYNRAIIVGGQTYGKATGQKIFPMQPGKTEMDKTVDIKSGWGFSTITALKIYRITGKTAQKYGVKPDIKLPDFYDYSDFREVFSVHALSADSITKKVYYTPLKPLPLNELRNKSEVRLATHEAFQLTEKCSRTLASLKERMDSISLTWNSYNKIINEERQAFQKLKEKTDQPTSAFKVNMHAFDKQRMQVDEYARQVNEGWMKNLVRDISLEEAFYILCDYIATPSTN